MAHQVLVVHVEEVGFVVESGVVGEGYDGHGGHDGSTHNWSLER